MAATKVQAHVDRAEQHAMEAERLLKGRLISSHVRAQVHATLALYYSTRSCDRSYAR
jgi:hypothetical protein